MEILIFPGFSASNKEWAVETKNSLSLIAPTTLIESKHWNTEKKDSDWIEKAVQEISEKIGDKKVNILAKSIGTYVLMKVLAEKSENIEKIILCGVPLTDLDEDDKKLYQNLEEFPAANLLCIQNENDNHGSFADTEKFLHAINPEFTVISKPREDHNYPYPEDFVKFLSL